MTKLTAKDFKPGRTLELHGEYRLDRSVLIPTGEAVRIVGNYSLSLPLDSGAKVGSGALHCFQVGPKSTLYIDSGGHYQLNEKQGVVKLFDPRSKPDIATGPKAYATEVWQLGGNLVWCEGSQEFIGKRCWSDGRPNKYWAMVATKPNGHVVIDQRGCPHVLMGGKNEAIIRLMQVCRAELYDVQTDGQTKQDVQIRSGDAVLVQGGNIESLEIGWLKDDTIANVNPLDRVDLNKVSIKRLTWGAGDFGRVFRDGKRIK